MNKSNYVTEKVQVLLSAGDIQSLYAMINQEALSNKAKAKGLSTYIRELIQERIREFNGTQKSFVQETIDKIIEENANKKE